MNEKDKKDTIDRYNERLDLYGYDPRTLGWLKGRQAIRFEVLSQIGSLDNCSLLDVGCGFGDLHGYLKKKGLNVYYTGYDINPRLIDIAREVYPDASFKVTDIEEETVDRKFDWVVASGIFNHKTSGSPEFIEGMLSRMFQLSIRGVACDFLSSYVSFTNEDAHYSTPESIFSFCKTISKRASLRHDYMPYEFCVYIYNDDEIDERNVFKRAFQPVS